MKQHKYAIEGIVSETGKEIPGERTWTYVSAHGNGYNAILLTREDGLAPTRCRDLGETDEKIDFKLDGIDHLFYDKEKIKKLLSRNHNH